MTHPRPLRPLQPTKADFRKWRRLIKAVRDVARNPLGPGGDLRAAAVTARRAVAPTRELWLSVCSPMVRLGEDFPGLGDACRAKAVETLTGYADVLGPVVGEGAPKGPPPSPPAGAVAMPAPPADPAADEEGRGFRRDVFG